VACGADYIAVALALVGLVFLLWLRLGLAVLEQIEGRQDEPAVIHHHHYHDRP
jgi:hypothetical protein